MNAQQIESVFGKPQAPVERLRVARGQERLVLIYPFLADAALGKVKQSKRSKQTKEYQKKYQAKYRRERK